jgi:hypothetical protein
MLQLRIPPYVTFSSPVLKLAPWFRTWFTLVTPSLRCRKKACCLQNFLTFQIPTLSLTATHRYTVCIVCCNCRSVTFLICDQSHKTPFLNDHSMTNPLRLYRYVYFFFCLTSFDPIQCPALRKFLLMGVSCSCSFCRFQASLTRKMR